ncbi:MAG: hypothetical protein ACLUQ6_05785 [Alistipes onderdonkii]
MGNERKLRLIQVAKEFKVGLNTITDFLQKKEHQERRVAQYAGRRGDLCRPGEGVRGEPRRRQCTRVDPRAYLPEADDHHPRRS